MAYSEEQLDQLESELPSVVRELQGEAVAVAFQLAPSLRVATAREFALYGVGRRLHVLARCVENVFEVFPPARTRLLTDDELHDVDINLHAFMININGILDNIAWVYVLENELESTVGGRHGVGLFLEATMSHLPNAVREYLSSRRDWHGEHAKYYRDSLAHRIPLYVPPCQIDPANGERYQELDRQTFSHRIAGDLELAAAVEAQRDELARVCLCFTGAPPQDDRSQLIVLHPQLIADARTVLEISRTLRGHMEFQRIGQRG